MGTATIPHPSSWQAPRTRAGRFACACATSLLVHVWAAHELPAGAPHARGGPTPLAVRLQPADEDTRAAQLAVEDATVRPRPVFRGPSMPQDAAQTRRAPGMARVAARPRPGVDAPGVAAASDPAYYSVRDLDVYPALLGALSIEYPARALAENRGGRARVMLMIDAAGKVNDVTVVESDPPGYFEDAARRTFEAAAFSAARRSGMPVRSRVLITLDFDPSATQRR